METMNIKSIFQTPVEQVQERFRIAQDRWQISFPEDVVGASARAALVAVALFFSLTLVAPYLHLLSVKVLISIAGALYAFEHFLPQLPPNFGSNPTAASNGTNKSSENEVATPLNQLNSLKSEE